MNMGYHDNWMKIPSAITTSLAASEIEDLIRLKCLDLPDIDFDLNIMTVDDYFRQFYK